MSAVVCGKRSYFEDSPAEWSPPKASKRVRCGGSPAHHFPSSPPLKSGPEGGATGAGSVHDALEQLRRHFPKMDTQVNYPTKPLLFSCCGPPRAVGALLGIPSLLQC